MTFPLAIPEPLRQALPPGTGVLLGISGGVDSALALAVLQHLQCDVLCVTLKNFCYSDDEVELTEKSCCSLEAIEDARRLAQRFGARYWVRDVAGPFRQKVIGPFIEEYSAARTPNPCLACNSDVRFPELVYLADQQGCRYAATGHYARIRECRLLTGLDPARGWSVPWAGGARKRCAGPPASWASRWPTSGTARRSASSRMMTAASSSPTRRFRATWSTAPARCSDTTGA